MILAAGAFNSPQILKLSGIGPREELARFGIPVVADLPGVGENLQDRYEISVVTRMASDFALLQGCGFRPPRPGAAPDPCYAAWQRGSGIYTTNGTILGFVRAFGAASHRTGSLHLRAARLLSWLLPRLLSRHRDVQRPLQLGDPEGADPQCRRHGEIARNDPRDVPEIDFHYFAEGSDQRGEDLSAVVSGVEFVRRMNQHLYWLDPVAKTEVVPGAQAELCATASGSSSLMRPGDITLPAATRWAHAATGWLSWIAAFGCMARRTCAWSMPPSFRTLQASSSPFRFIWSAKRLVMPYWQTASPPA